MKTGTLSINTDRLLPIIKKWLYTDKEIFLRELVSNACDALKKLKIASQAPLDSLRIAITIDNEKKCLIISDTGIGMSAEEVEKYIAQIAFSGAEEFLKSYEAKDEIIGHFGLGFYSAYMVADRVDIETLSFKEGSTAAFWSCDGSSNYSLTTGSRLQAGTDVILHINEENSEFLEESTLRQLLQKYCLFLPYPLYLNGSQINEKEPLWTKPANECTDKEYIDFYRQLYPFDEDPLFWVHFHVDYPFYLRGILYFPKIHAKFDWSKNNIKLFSNRVFVTDNCRDILPDFLTALRGTLDSPDIPLNVSRSTLQIDKTVRQLTAHIAKKVADRLAAAYAESKTNYIAAWPDLETTVKLGCLQDEKFYERIKESLIWRTLSDKWTTIEEIGTDTIFYTNVLHPGPLAKLYESKGSDVLLATCPIDTALMHHLEKKCSPLKFQRIDGAAHSTILDASKEKQLLDSEGRTESFKIADFIKKLIDKPVNVEAKSLASDSIPAFLVIPEEERRLREFYLLTQETLPDHFAQKQTFVVNTNSPLIQRLYALKETTPDLAKEMTLHLYDLSLLSQKELPPKELPHFIERSSKLLEKLASY